MLGNSNATPTVAVEDLEAARRFYETVLGLEVKEELPEMQTIVYKSGTGELQVYVSDTAGSNKSTYATWEVDDVAVVAAELKARGAQFEHYPDMPDTKLDGDVHVWGDKSAAWFKDPDGNILCLHD
jgi:catechol 2,3-dioxygenase-like lactoylglutathione lyase family enzyme